MKRKYKNVRNRPLPIEGIGSVGGREIFYVEDHQMTHRIRQLEKNKDIRLLEITTTVIVPDEPEMPQDEPEIQTEVVSESQVNQDENEIDDSNTEKEDNLLTNDGEMMESEEEIEEEADSDDSIDNPSTEKKRKKKGRKGKQSSDRA